jgi:hypothetical protein
MGRTGEERGIKPRRQSARLEHNANMADTDESEH